MNWYELLSGLGLFLFGMKVLEDALRDLAGRSFRAVLRKSTSYDLLAALAGLVATTLLQSSTVVSLMVLAFVGAGMIPLRGAVGIILGSNLGSTTTGWLVASFGFKLPLAQVAMVLLGVCGIAGALLKPGTKRLAVTMLFFGFGLFLFGLDLMKHGVETWAKTLDVSPFAGLPRIALVGIGFAVAAIIHSSGGAMMMALAALHSQVFSLVDAAAFMVGADLGTTMTAIFGAIGGTPDKKRVAAAHFLFNLLANLAGFLLLDALLHFIQNRMGITDPLFALTAFHTGFNVVAVLVFLPFTGPFAWMLGRMFRREEAPLARYLAASVDDVPEAALAAAGRETAHLFGRVARLNRAILEIAPPAPDAWLSEAAGGAVVLKTADGFSEEYDRIKQLEGLLLEHFARVQRHPLDEAQVGRIDALLTAVRHAVTSAKMIKDVREDLGKFRQELHPGLDEVLRGLAASAGEFYSRLDGLNPMRSKSWLVETLAGLHQSSGAVHEKVLRALYQKPRDTDVPDWELSTLLNVNRAVHGSAQAFTGGLASLLLEPAEVKTLETLGKA